MSKEWQVVGLVRVGARKGLCALLRHWNLTPCTVGGHSRFFKSSLNLLSMHPLSETTEECIPPQKVNVTTAY